MLVPSASVWVVTITVIAEYGAPVTTLPGCISSKPRISIRGPISPPRPMPPCGGGGPSGGGSCARNIAGLARSAPNSTASIQFLPIPVSPLLLSRFFCCARGKRIAQKLVRCFRQTIRLWLPVGPHQQIHLHHIVGVLFIHGQTQSA